VEAREAVEAQVSVGHVVVPALVPAMLARSNSTVAVFRILLRMNITHQKAASTKG
jgi:hypothetical protein